MKLLGEPWQASRALRPSAREKCESAPDDMQESALTMPDSRQVFQLFAQTAEPTPQQAGHAWFGATHL